MRKRWVACLSLLAAPALAQRMGGRSSGPPPVRQAPVTAEEAARAATAKEFADAIEKGRANAPPPPLPQIRFPTENEKLLGRLRMVEDQHKELRQYLDKLWKEAKEPLAQRAALDGLWRDAEKPKAAPRWLRSAIEEYYKQQSKGLALHPPDEKADAPKPAEAKAPVSANTAP